MTTFTATRAASTFPVAKPSTAGVLMVAWGTFEVGGTLTSDDMDTNATETLDLDLGWADNGVEAADPDGLGNFGVFTTDTVAGIKPESGYNFPIGGTYITDGPKAFSAETIIQVTTVATAATFAAGTLSVVIFYTVP